ncbi:PREDICTED: uncharacterized protein LOC109244466 [Nicotiana attenuata]|uniref:uncharacterized protein LOC109244466 n=1 Tax=Nicotiana attenuata TaxID=49451 RepID=UPI000904963B|nr:PREDICTED: uncharacterized protein LOC109244466 [Nicotiana attenuata]
MSYRLQNIELIEKQKALKCELEKWVMIEESIYKQRSRVQWLKPGDSNSAYFFAQMKNRSLNGIQILTNDMGTQLVMEDDIEAEILGYYKKLLGSRADNIPAINPNVMKLGAVLNRDQQLQLIKPVTKEEKYWQIIGENVTQAVLEFFETTQMYRSINCTAITLVPKVRNPASIKEDLSPVVLCYTK